MDDFSKKRFFATQGHQATGFFALSLFLVVLSKCFMLNEESLSVSAFINYMRADHVLSLPPRVLLSLAIVVTGVVLWFLLRPSDEPQEAEALKLWRLQWWLVPMAWFFLVVGSRPRGFIIFSGRIPHPDSTWAMLTEVFIDPPWLLGFMISFALCWLVCRKLKRPRLALQLLALHVIAFKLGQVWMADPDSYTHVYEAGLVVILSSLLYAVVKGLHIRLTWRFYVLYFLLASLVMVRLLRLGESPALPPAMISKTLPGILLFFGLMLLGAWIIAKKLPVEKRSLWWLLAGLLFILQLPLVSDHGAVYVHVMAVSLTFFQLFLEDITILLLLTLGLILLIPRMTSPWWRGLRHAVVMLGIAGVLCDTVAIIITGNRLSLTLFSINDNVVVLIKTQGLMLLGFTLGSLVISKMLFGRTGRFCKRQFYPGNFVKVMVRREKWVKYSLVMLLLWSTLVFSAQFSDLVITDNTFLKLGREVYSELAMLSEPEPQQWRQEAQAAGFSFTQPGLQPSRFKPGQYNVIHVLLESAHCKNLALFEGDYAGLPVLLNYRDRMELFTNYYTTFPASCNARFSHYSGLFPTHEITFKVNPKIKAPSLFEYLKEAGYETAFFESSYLDFGSQWDFLEERGLDVAVDGAQMEVEAAPEDRRAWGVDESVTLNKITRFLEKKVQAQQPFYLTYAPVMPHHPFDGVPEEFCSNQPEGRGFERQEAAYRNSLNYLDQILARLLQSVDDLGLKDRTIVIFTSDHGTLFTPTKLGHGWMTTPELCHNPLIVMHPQNRQFRINTTLASHIDFMPSVLAMLGIPLKSGHFMQGQSVWDVSAQRRVYILSYSNEKAYLEHDWFYHWGDGGRLRKYRVTHQGAKTIFQKIEPNEQEADLLGEHLNQFSYLQEQLIRYYELLTSESAAFVDEALNHFGDATADSEK